VPDSPLRNWEQLYEAAALETDDSKLLGKIDEAEAEIKRCLEEAEKQPKDGDASALERALVALEILRNERLSGKV
jgi:hypothetical protein